MNPDKNQVIVQYLLGSLPAAEAERLDELSVSDEEFANALSVAENDLVDSYVQGELKGETLERFNSHYLASPLRSDKVRFAEGFQRWAQQDTAKVDRSSAETEKPSSWSFLTAPSLALQWGFAAAALVLLVTVGWLVFENMRLLQHIAQTEVQGGGIASRQEELQKQLEAQRAANAANEQELARVRQEQERLQQELKKTQEQRSDVQGEQRATREQPPSTSGATSLASFILSPQMRGAGGVTTITIPAKTDQVEMRLNLEPDDHPAYQVMLIDPASNQILWRSNRLKARGAGDGKSLTIRLSAGLLKPQAYILRVNGVSAGGASETISDYAFKLGKH